VTGRRKAVWVGGGLVLAAVVVAVVVSSSGGDSSGSSSGSAGGAAPSRGEVVEVAKLAGEAHSLLGGLLGSVPPAEAVCLDQAGRLDELIDPAGLYRLAGEVPDAVTSELFVDLAASTNRFLAACGEGDEVLRGELAYQWVLVDRRLEDLGVES